MFEVNKKRLANPFSIKKIDDSFDIHHSLVMKRVRRKGEQMLKCFHKGCVECYNMRQLSWIIKLKIEVVQDTMLRVDEQILCNEMKGNKGGYLRAVHTRK